jgi:hypothetical protein
VTRVVVPAHHNYQVRLQAFLTARGVEAEWERDFIDVRFTLGGAAFIGEIKVTSYLTIDEAVRIAAGQLLFYGHTRFETLPNLVMLLDRPPTPTTLKFASTLNIAVVVEETPGFRLLNPHVAPLLNALFGP